MKTKSATFQMGETIEWEAAGEGVRRQIMGYDDRLMIVKVFFSKGSVGALHTHPHSQVSYITSGRFEVTVGDEKRIVTAGDGYYVAPDTVHGVLCLEEGIIIDTFSPLRNDFLEN